MTTDEASIRAVLTEHAVASMDGAEILAGVRRRRMRRRRGLVAIVTVSAVVAASAVALTVGRSGGNSTQRISPSGPPANTQTVNFRGVEVSVPQSWRVVDEDCDDPTDHIVTLAEGATCSDVLINNFPTNLTQLHFYAAESPEGADAAKLATKTVSVSDQRGMEGMGTIPDDREPVKVLVIPAAGVVVAVESPDPASDGSLLDSARITPLDENGCAAKVASLVAPIQATARALVPQPLAAATLCRYQGYQLARSIGLTAAQTVQLSALLKALPAGVSHPGSGSFEPESRCASELARGFIVHLRGADVQIPDVYVHISGCTTLSASNGGVTTKIDAPLVDFLTGVGAYDSGFPDPGTLD